MTEKVVFFLDYANINRAARENRYRLDYQNLLTYVGEGRSLLDAHCYVPINPRNEHRLDGEIEDLWRAGYLVTTKVGTLADGTYKCNFDVEIAMDVLRVVYQVKPDIIVLASGDADFVPLVQEVRKAGIRVEVAAFVETAGPRRCSSVRVLLTWRSTTRTISRPRSARRNARKTPSPISSTPRRMSRTRMIQTSRWTCWVASRAILQPVISMNK